MVEYRDSLVRKNSEIYGQSLNGVITWVRSIWAKRIVSPELTVVLSSSHEVQRTLEQLKKQTAGTVDSNAPAKLPMPWVSMVLLSEEVASSGRQNPYMTRREGMNVGYINNRRQEVREYITPVNVGLGLRFVTNNVEELQAFARIWLSYWPVAGFVLRNALTGAEISIKIRPDQQLSMPTADFATAGDLMVLETTLFLETWSGETGINTTIKRFDLDAILSGVQQTNNPTIEKTSWTYLDMFDETKSRGALTP
jgi:hypothetical protein